jgi:NADH-quinone oxidoreductase subunit H
VVPVGSLNLVELGRVRTAGSLAAVQNRPFLAFFTYYIASLASCKRSPFDLPEGESELVAGFHTEYSGFRFVMFFFAEYMGMFAVSAVATVIFLGGWNSRSRVGQPLWFVAKSTFLVWVQMWFRWTLPRIRIDQVMHACVKYLLPFTCCCSSAAVGGCMIIRIIPYPFARQVCGSSAWACSCTASGRLRLLSRSAGTVVASSANGYVET